jgi:hypothetical protein
MKQPEVSAANPQQLRQLGLTQVQVRRQIEIFRKPCAYVR